MIENNYITVSFSMVDLDESKNPVDGMKPTVLEPTKHFVVRRFSWVIPPVVSRDK